jgi:NAD+ synthase
MISNEISNWIKSYASEFNRDSLVVGISGGVDSSVVSTLCAMTELPVYVLSMPIRQKQEQNELSTKHGEWLVKKFSNVSHCIVPLDRVYSAFQDSVGSGFDNELAFANSKSRLRMVALHQISGSKKGLVVGTGNKVEDFGVGFFTKYGDGGVDISPIADLYKSEVYELAKELNVLQEIIDAPPTDGLWEDGRTDKDQLGGLTYDQLERSMKIEEQMIIGISKEENNILTRYKDIRKINLHKMNPIPVFKKNTNNEIKVWDEEVDYAKEQGWANI